LCFANDFKTQPAFTRLVLVVIDALRMDFVFSEDSGMRYLQSLIRKKQAFGYNAHADSPTVTLPRIKVRSFSASR
jgi:ethanolaminephosphotransferase